jgi:hypothetical protein
MPAKYQQIPRLDYLAAQGQGALVALRPEARKHIHAGWYGAILRGWRGQLSTCRSRLGAEVEASRLGLAEGEALQQLASSEYWATLAEGSREAVGEVSLRRTVDNASAAATGNFQAGTIPIEARFSRIAAATAQPAREAAVYLAREPVYAGPDDTAAVQDLGGGQYRHTQDVTVIVDAEREGEHANTPEFVAGAGVELAGAIVSTLFDSTFTLTSLRAGGGQEEIGDDQIRAFAGSSYRGRLGPIESAILAGAYSHGGIWRAVLVDDGSDGIGKLYLADQSWAYSQTLLDDVVQVLNGQGPEGGGEPRRWLGFGARVEARSVVNQRISVRLAITLRSPEYAEQTSPITKNIRAVLADYFDNRPDWFTWRTNGIGAAVSGADNRILACTSATVLDQDGGTLTEPATQIDPVTTSQLTHFYLVDDSLDLTYSTPA